MSYNMGHMERYFFGVETSYFTIYNNQNSIQDDSLIISPVTSTFSVYYGKSISGINAVGVYNYIDNQYNDNLSGWSEPSFYDKYYIGKKLRAVLVSILDLMAAIPSIIYGLWGYLVLMPSAAGWAESINKYFGWIPFFKVDVENFDASPFISALVLGLMIIPIASSVTREVYSRAPQDQISAAYALGSSRWGALKAVVLPFGRSGLIGGMLLGLGRALGETVAVLLTLNLVFEVKFQVLASAGGNVASLIASRFGEAGPFEVKALMAAGLVLFLLTLVVNFGASFIVSRTSKASQ